jgi:hypothetical protein
MIGVLARVSDVPVVREFFELFKTPWEFYREGREYDVLLCAADINVPQHGAKLVVVYAGGQTAFDVSQRIHTRAREKVLVYRKIRVPIYGNCARIFAEAAEIASGDELPILTLRTRTTTVARIGYDLFDEVLALLTTGQSKDYARVPTLELHISLLRDLIAAFGVQLVEIPPVPEGYNFIACLTHDVDHPSIRLHNLDHTIFGFLYRSVIGSALAFLRKRTSLKDLMTNWTAALKLPFVYLGLAEDFWLQADSYRKLDGGLPSTYFVIPFRDRSGKTEQSDAPRRRKSKYGASGIRGFLGELLNFGYEIGLHGIDAWIDENVAREELEEIRRYANQTEIGTRMHWLYFNESSPEILERAGVSYDSTVGYCDTIGYKAGTMQAYKPVNSTSLLELPLHAMDTAMFFPCYMNLARGDAQQHLSRMIDDAVEYGGCLTIDWHDRSAAPERLWGRIYTDLINELKAQGAWFATAAQAVAWFRKRRAVSFEDPDWRSNLFTERGDKKEDGFPPLQVRALNGSSESRMEVSHECLR